MGKPIDKKQSSLGLECKQRVTKWEQGNHFGVMEIL